MPDSPLASRARLLKAVREFFESRHVMEVETPMMSRSGNSDPGIRQFRIEDGGPWLRTSAEYPMKRLLCAGVGDIYELGRVFRAGESGRRHNPEFTMLEWYRVGMDYHELMAETAALVQHCGKLFGRDWPVEKTTYRDWVVKTVGLDPLIDNSEDFLDCIKGKGLDVHGLDELNRDQLLDLLVSHLAQDSLPGDTITMVHDYPASQAALARIRPDSPPVAERFEIFLGNTELANGYHELTDADEQRARFESENRKRLAAGERAVPLDEHLLAAMAGGMPECAGVALGVDRLLMACGNFQSIDEALAFPADQA